jgi:hypothetical protein
MDLREKCVITCEPSCSNAIQLYQQGFTLSSGDQRRSSDKSPEGGEAYKSDLGLVNGALSTIVSPDGAVTLCKHANSSF